MDDLLRLERRGAVVTGAGRGIGLAIAHRLAAAGANVALLDVDASALAAAARSIAEAVPGAQPQAFVVDVTDETALDTAAEQAAASLGGLRIWVNNAGVYPRQCVLDMSTEHWQRVQDVNLRAVLFGARAGARRMIEGGVGGVVLNLASTASFKTGGTGLAAYVAAKHGVIGLTKALAVELGPHGIRVLAVAPSMIETPGLEEARVAVSAGGFQHGYETLPSRMLVGRIGKPDDVACVVLFAASDMAGFMTGSTLVVDGGDLAW